MSSNLIRSGDNNREGSLVHVGRASNYSFRAIMFATRLILFGSLLSAKSASSESYLVKCCPPGQLYSGSFQVNCVSVSSDAVKLHFFHLNATEQPQGHPLCIEPEDFVTTALDDFVPDEYLEVPACLEILHDQKTGDSVPIVVHCRSGKDRQVEAISASFPPITYVRKCCPHDAIFDRHMKTCVSSNNESSLLMFLPNGTVNEDRVLITTKGSPKCEGPIIDYEIDESDVFFRNNIYSVMIPTINNSDVKEEYFITKDNACLDTTSNTNRRLIARVCRNKDYCDRNACIRKCCTEGEVFYSSGCRKPVAAVEEPMEFHSEFAKAINATQSSFDITKDYGLLFGNSCLHGLYLVNPAEEKWLMTSQGHLEVKNYPVYNLDQACMEVYYNKSDYNIGFHLFVCFDDLAEQSFKASYKVNTFLQFTSCAFLLMTLLVYACLPSLQNLHGKTLMCHVSSLLLAFTCLAIIPWVSFNLVVDLNGMMPCKVLAYSMLFFFLSAFSWLNVMCFDIWWTFGSLRRNTVTRGRKHKRRFLLYCLYAWGFSLLVSILAVVFDYTDILPNYARPMLGFSSCWFKGSPEAYGEMIFFIGPMMIQLISNVVFFVLTSIHCNQVKTEITRVTSGGPTDLKSKQFYSDRNRFAMNVKLFIVMGMSWVCEIVSFFLKKYNLEWQYAIFYVSDVFNCLQGLLIFILFVLKLRVYVALRRRLGLDAREKRACDTTLRDPYRMRKSVSSSTIMSTFAVSSAP